MRRALTVASVASITVAVLVAPAVAGPPLMVKAKQAGYPAQNCQYCHVSKLPKKEEFKLEELNERGQWLAAEKRKQSAKDVNVEWLKDYPGGK